MLVRRLADSYNQGVAFPQDFATIPTTLRWLTFERQCIPEEAFMYVETEILFPPRIIPQLRDAAGVEFRKLVEHVSSLSEGHPESLAFTLMMVRLNGCLECETDSFRAMRGCALCALQTLRRFRTNEKELIRLYKAALKDIQAHPATASAAAPVATPVATPAAPQSQPARAGRRSTPQPA